MQATRPNVFDLRKTGLESFLYADVGPEANGSTLTILSILARLGKDPWMEAARWTALPRSVVIETLARSIAEMPLAPAALAGAHASAARLVQLLPEGTHTVSQSSAPESAPTSPRIAPITILYCALIVGMALSLLLIPRLSADPTLPTDHPPLTATRAFVTGTPSAARDR